VVLPPPRWADKRNGAARRNSKIDIPQNRYFVVIGKAHILIDDVAPNIIQSSGAGFIGNIGPEPHDLYETAEPRHAGGKLFHKILKPSHGLQECVYKKITGDKFRQGSSCPA
jgi:hypothetical protein